MPRVITKNDLMPMAEYGRIRHDNRKKLVEIKRDRRIHIGPYVTLYFENYDTMWSQVHEMLYIERGGEAQIDGELAAFNPLIPKGSELVATMMIEIEDERVRRQVLSTLGHIEDMVSLRFGGLKVVGAPEEDVDRTNEEGKTSSVHFLHFPFSDEAKTVFKKAGTEVIIGCGHPKYGHMAVMPEDMRASLAKDFD